MEIEQDIMIQDVGDSFINEYIKTDFNKSPEKKEFKGGQDKKKEKYCNFNCTFPTAYTILIIIEVFVFLLTYVIPKGNFAKIEYSTKNKVFIIKYPLDDIEIYENATQDTLDKYNITIPLENFVNNYIKKPISIPDTYQKIDNETTSFFSLFEYPMLGLVESADISFLLMVMGGILNILIEMNALSAGMAALSRVTKGKEFLLLILVFIIMSIGGSTIGLFEEILAFYPILMPIFLKSGFDGIISMSPLFLGVIVGNMFSTFNAFSVVLASYSAGINFIDGITFRIISFIIGDTITIFYFLIYHLRIKKDERKSIVYEIKDELVEKFLKNNKKNLLEKDNNLNKGKEADNKDENEKNNSSKKEGEENNKKEIDNNLFIKEKEEDNQDKKKLLDILDEKVENNPLYIKEEIEKDEREEINNNNLNENNFTFIQKISLIIFGSGFVEVIIGVILLDWWFIQMASLFIVIAIILMFLLRKGEKKSIEAFIKGAGDFCGVAIIIGMARGINITLENGKISDTILNSLSNLIDGIPKIYFSILMLLIFIFMGFFIQSSSGLSVLSMPVFAPLADKVGCKRNVIVNAFMFGQNLIGLISPTGLILIILQMVGIKFNHWIKFIWPIMAILFGYLLVLIIINASLN